MNIAAPKAMPFSYQNIKTELNIIFSFSSSKFRLVLLSCIPNLKFLPFFNLEVMAHGQKRGF